MKTLARFAGLVGIAILAAACSTVPAAKNMQVDDYAADRSHRAPLGVNVEGGWDLPGQIANEEFLKAVETSLVSSKVFSRIVRIEDAVYRLDVVVGDLRQPPGGFDMTTVMTVLWSLSRVDTQDTVWQQLVESSHTATVGDAFAGVVRLRKSAEGAARKNIRRALELMANAALEAREKASAQPSP